MTDISIGNRKIGAAHPPFIIAEVGINHNGELEKALEMIQVAKAAGADCVKFQTFKAKEFVADPKQMFTYKSQGREVTESMLAMFQRYELRRQDWNVIKKECDAAGITFMSTPQNRSDLDILLEVGVPAVKIGSDDFTNLPLLKSYTETGLPLIASCGMADLGEIYRSLETIGALDGYPTILLLCTSQYPTPPHDVNLRKLATLSTAFPQVALGFSDHTQGPLASSLAAALGALVFEKHFTLSQDLPGPDHWFSETPETLRKWVDGIRTATVMLGSHIVRPTEAEREMRIVARRSITAIRDIKAGELCTRSNVGLRRPGSGLGPELLSLIIGGKAARDIGAGDRLTFGDVTR